MTPPSRRVNNWTRGPLRLAGVALTAALLLNWGYVTWAVHASAGNTQRSFTRAVRIGEQRAAREEQLLCLSFARLAKLRPPPGDPAANPSRAYLQQEHAVLAGMGRDIGCPAR